MNREEYLRQLENALGFMPEDARNELMSFYTEMLDDRIEDGMDELAAVAAMEKPEDIAARQRAEYPRKEEEPLTDEAMKFSSLAGSVLHAVDEALRGAADALGRDAGKRAGEDLQKEKESIRQQEESMKESIRQQAESIREQAQAIAREAENAAREAGNTAEENIGEYVKKTFVCPADRLTAARLLCEDMPVRVAESADGQAWLTYYTCDRDPYFAEEKGGVLTLQKAPGASGRARFGFFSFGDGVRFLWRQSFPTVELLLPRHALLDLYAHTVNGSIQVSDLQALCNAETVSSNARITFSHVTCKALEAKTSNARLVLEEISVRQNLRGKTSNGRIEASGVTGGGEVTLTTSNGRIQADDVSARESLRLATSNSSIEVHRLNAPALELKTSNGSISGELPGAQRDWDIESGTSNGHNSLPARQPGPKPLRVRTSNGSIRLRFEEG